MERLAAEHRALVEDLVRPYGISGRRLHFLTGRPAKTLVPFIQELDADLVVMGAVSKGALEALLIGNTAERILDTLPCDILVVKSQPLEVKASAPVECITC
jgi:universal stress protein E